MDWAAVIGGLSEAVVAADASGRVLYVNAAVTSLLGWHPEDLLGTPLTQIIPERLRTAHSEGFGRFARSGQGRLLGRPLRVPALRQDGTETPVELVVNGITFAGRPVVVGLLRDVSDRVELEGPGELADRLVATLAESASLDEAWPRVLAAVVESLQWDLAQLWLADDAQGPGHRQQCFRHLRYAMSGKPDTRSRKAPEKLGPAVQESAGQRPAHTQGDAQNHGY